MANNPSIPLSLSGDYLYDLYDPPGLDPAESAQDLAYFEALAGTPSGWVPTTLEEQAESLSGYTEPGNWLTSFWSALGPEFIGRDPSLSVEAYRRESPFGSMTSQITGVIAPFAIPYVGGGVAGLRLAAKLPLLSKMVQFAKVAEHPVRAAAAKEVARFAPLELARVGGAAVLGDEGAVASTAGHAAFDLAIFGGIGGLGGVLRGARPLPRDVVQGEALIQEALPVYDLRWSPHEKLRALSVFQHEADAAAKAKVGSTVEKVMGELKTQVRSAEPGYRIAAVKELEWGPVEPKSGSAAAQALNKLFIPGGRADLKVRRFVADRFGFRSSTALKEAEDAALPPDWELYSLFARYVEPTTDNAAVALQRTLLGNMQRVDPKWYMAKQQNGIYVLAQRLKGRTMPLAAGPGEAKVAKASDRWLLLQTDNPGVFMPNAERFAESLNLNAYREAEKVAYNAVRSSIPAFRQMDELNKLTPDTMPLVGVESGKRATAIARRLGDEDRILMQEAHHLARFFSKRMKEFVAPALHQFSDSPRAVMMYQKMRTMFNAATARTSTEFFGLEGAPHSRTLLGQIFEKGSRTGSIEDRISRLTKKGLEEVNEHIALNTPIEEIRRIRGMDPTAKDLLLALDRMDGRKTKEMLATFKHTGEEGYTPLRAHYMVSRSWEGAHRIPIYDDAGRLVWIASGKNRALATAEAKHIVERVLAEDGLKLTAKFDDLKVWGREQDLREILKVNLELDSSKAAMRVRTEAMKTKPLKRFEERAEPKILGYRTELSKKELKEMVYQHMLESNRYMAGQALVEGLAKDYALLAKEHPALKTQLQQRFSRFMGEASEFDRAITQAVDKTLAPFFGPNVAGRIVRSTNRGLFTLTLGMGDYGFVALNAATPIQTAMPEIAYLLSAPPERLAKYYTAALVMGRKGPHVVHHLEPLKQLRVAFRDMLNPSDELRASFTKAQREMIISPRFIEAFVGESSEAVSSFKKVLTGEQGVVNYIMRLSEFGPAKSEEFSRGLAFVMGHNVGRDFFGLQGKALYKFASEFTGRTMYNYGTGDRAKVITGSIGTLFGLFKNWSMHYMANFMAYTGEGVMRGNWKPLLWQNAGTFSLAGLGAIPGYGVASNLSELFTDETLMEQTYQMFGYAEPVAGQFVTERVSDAFFYGFPGLFGMTLQGRAAPPGAELVRDVNMFFSLALWDRAVHAGAAIGDTLDQAKTLGKHPVDSRKVRDEFARAFLPRTMYRALQTSIGGGIRSLSTGNMLISPISIPERFMFLLGITPTDIDKIYTINDELFRDQAKLRERISIYGNAIAEAEVRGDYRESLRLYRDSWLEGLPSDSIARSANSYQTKLVEPLMERQFTDAALEAKKRALQFRR